ncbi:MAG: WD40/YVTN/BNR-like repeat-containing protein [Cytophagales bacterium]|nr:MAG: sialidase [Rhodothermaeota bacterium MED-G18]|tara:strand:+ start:6420 stop:9608 length:3189 start_codon:yes stop_codon:yes gene_type:complete
MRNKFYILIAILIPFLSNSQEISKTTISDMKFRHVGPVGNRLTCVAGVADQPMVYYVGAASGGVWKTKDGGLNWFPIFDGQEVHSIGAVAVAPSNPMVVYVGTGESSIRSNVSIGDGVYKSEDGGETWEHIGLKNSGRISRIIVHPDDPDKVYVGALGHAYSPQRDRGVYVSHDGGGSWKHTLFVDQNTGISDMAMDTDNPRVLFAGAWHLELKTWKRISGGPGSGIFKSTDGGMTWDRLVGNGLPTRDVGKIALAMTPAAPDRLYALIETGDGVPYEGRETDSGELWRSEDNGKTFKLINSNRDLGGRQAYYTRTTASPDNPNEVYFMSNSFFSSIDGGISLENRPRESSPNWDHHEMWIDPNNGDRMAVAGDGGISISHNRGKTWHRTFLPIAQLYHVTTDNNIPYNVLTNRQDGPSMKGPSRTRSANWFGPGMIQSGMWRSIGGGESGFATADPKDPDIIWSSASGYGPLGGIVTRYNEKTNQYRQLEVWPELTSGSYASLLKYRFQWTFPLLISPHDNKTIYVTSQYVHRTTNDGQTWEVISPDLSLNDKGMQGFSGGLTGDNIAVEYSNVIYAFEESPVKEGLFWAGTNDGLVHISQDGGKNWTNVTKNIPNLPKLGVVRNIEASRWDEGKAYLTIEFHQVGNFDPHVYKTENYGKSWKKITEGISEGNLSYTRCIKEDPIRKGLLYLGTENKLYVSFNDGGNWQELMSNLPHTPMYWIDIQEHFNDLVIGTYGRGIWILDDLSPIQQLSEQVTKKSIHLFDIKSSYRFQNVTSTLQMFPEASTGQDPPSGASLNYWLDDAKDVEIVITNSEKDTVKTISDKGKKGINRVWWNFMGEKSDAMVMRTKPLYADWFSIGDDRVRNVPSSISIMQPPGKYNVSVVSGGVSSTKELEVIKDPHSEGTLGDIKMQNELVGKIYNDLNVTTEYVNTIESVRRQLLDLNSVLIGGNMSDDLIKEVDDLENKFLDLEKKLLQLKITGKGQDGVRYEKMIGEKLSYLAQNVQISDFRPADSYYEVYELLHKRLEEVGVQLETLVSNDLNEFVKKMNTKGINTIVLK